MALSARVCRASLTAIAVVAVAGVTPLAAAAPAVAVTPAVSRLCAPPADTVPPQLTSLTFNRRTVDLKNGPRTVTVTAHVTDTAAGAASGVGDIEIEFSDGDISTESGLNLASGTPADGIWKGSVDFFGPGIWSLDEVIVSDADGNSQLYGRDGKTVSSPTDLRLHPDWPSSVTVKRGGTSTPPSHPAAKPGKLTAFRLTPKAVNTTHHAKTVKVTATFTGHRPRFVDLLLDDGSGGVEIDSASLSKGGGLRFPSATSGYARLASGKAALDGFFFKLVELKRTTHDHWVGHVRIGRWAGHVVAEPSLFASFGGAVKPQFKVFDQDRLKALHFTHSLKITSGVDRTKPALSGLRVTPSSVDTTSGSQLVTVTARAKDTQSGVALVRAEIVAPHGRGVHGSDLIVRMVRNGNVWTGQAKIRECVPGGAWRVSVALVDHADNVAFFSAKKLLAAGLPGQLSVTSHPGDSQPPTVKSATASAAGHMITLDFSEGVKNVTDSTLNVFALAPASARFRTPLAISNVVCSDGTGVVDCSGSGGLVTSAVLTVPDVAAGQDYQVWANQGSVASQLTDHVGNPLDWSSQAAAVTGS